MIKTSIISFFFIITLITSSFSAGSSSSGSGDSGSSKTRTQYDMALTYKAAKKFEAEDKLKKAKKDTRKLKNF